MTVKELQDMLDRSPELNELIIIDATDENPEDVITLYVDEVTVSSDPKGVTYITLKQ